MLVRMRIPRVACGGPEEFLELATAADLEAVAWVEGSRRAPHPRHFVGSGKLQEIARVAQETDAALVVFDHELTPVQERNLERAIGRRVMSRTELILDIFARRARTYEGKLQVELAQLEHAASRLVRGWTHLDRQRGGIGLRGVGEAQIELDQRMIGQRIKAIERQLSKVRSQRRQSRRYRSRAEVATVALVGYTNAGKSSLFNGLTDAGVEVRDQLFATLDPTLRRLTLPGIGEVVLADTVGFISRLPHHLVAAFKATLEEVAEADLLLHVVDASSERYPEQMEDVLGVLEEIGAGAVPRLDVFNKIDRLDSCAPRTDRGADDLPQRTWVSATQPSGLEELAEAVAQRLGVVEGRELVLSPNEAALRSWLHDRRAILEEHTECDGSIRVRVRLSAEEFERMASRRGAVLRGLGGPHRMRQSVRH